MYLLQSTVCLLPIRPSECFACDLPSSSSRRYCSTIASASGIDSTPSLTSFVGVDLARRLLAADLLVHERLRRGRLVGLVVAELAIADQVDDHVLVERHAVVHREARHEHDCFDVVAVHVEDRRLDHLGDVAAVERRARIAWIGDREADLVVDDDVDRAAGVEAARLRHLQRLHHDALPGEGGVAVDQDRRDLVALRVVAALLARAHGTFDHRVDHFEMRRIESQRDVHVARRRADVGREALVVLHVARAAHVVRVVVTFEFREQLLRRLADDVDQHVEAPAMRHADHDFLDAALPALLDQIVEQRNQRVAAFEREALLRRVLRREIALEPFGGGQVTQERAALFVREAILHATCLEAVLQPQALGRIRHVRELGADRAAVDVAQLLDDVAELHALRDRRRAAAGMELGVEIRIAQAEVLELQHLRHRPSHQAERIDVGEQMTAIRVHLDETSDRSLLRRNVTRSCCCDAARWRRCGRRTRRALCERLADWPMRRIVAAAEAPEIVAPGRLHRVRIGEELFVERFDVGCVAGPQGARFEQCSQRVAHCARKFLSYLEMKAAAGPVKGRLV